MMLIPNIYTNCNTNTVFISIHFQTSRQTCKILLNIPQTAVYIQCAYCERVMCSIYTGNYPTSANSNRTMLDVQRLISRSHEFILIDMTSMRALYEIVSAGDICSGTKVWLDIDINICYGFGRNWY